MNKAGYCFVFILLLLNTVCFSGNSVDSLYRCYLNTSDTSRYTILTQAYKTAAETNSERALQIALELDSLYQNNNFYLPVDIVWTIANLYERSQQNSKATQLYSHALSMYKERHDTTARAIIANQLGYNLYVTGAYDQAIAVLLDNLKMCSTSPLQKYRTRTYTSLGFVYRAMRQFDLATDYFRKSHASSIKWNDLSYTHTALNEIGNIHTLQGNYDSAVDYQKRSIEIKKQLGDSLSLMYSYNDIAITFYYLEEYNTAIDYYIKSSAIARATGDSSVVIANLINMSSLYKTLNNIVKARQCIDQAEELASRLKSYPELREIYNSKSALLALEGDFEQAYLYHIAFFNIHDSLWGENVSKQINELQAKYESEKKEKEIELLSKDKIIREIELEQQNEKLKKQQIIIASFILGFFVILVFTILIIRQNKTIRKANRKLLEHQQEIMEKNEELKQQTEEIHTINDQLHFAYNQISEKNDEILDSIHYASSIQRALIPDITELGNFFSESFILYRPRDIVSGDFFWYRNTAIGSLVALADCTGHGVPGALMSMLGLTFLNEAVDNKNLSSPELILNFLRQKIISSLHQQGITGEQHDGMDISLISVSNDKKKLDFSGANNPLYILRNGSVIEYKADKMPVCYYERMADFSLTSIELHENDILYLFTDGYMDQFGGNKGKKLMVKPFRDLLASTSSNGLAIQKEKLEQHLAEWKKDYDQVDDITILGLKL